MARSRRSSASRLQRRSRGGRVDEDDEDAADEARELETPLQYTASRVVLLALAPDALAVLRTSQAVAEPVCMVFSAGHGRLLIAGGVGQAGSAAASASPMRLVALPDVVGYPLLDPTPAAVTPGPPPPWPAFLGANGWPQTMTVLSLQHRLQAALTGGQGGEGPLLLFKTMLMGQPLHALQSLRAGAEGTGRSASSATHGREAAAVGGVDAWGLLLPSTLGDLRAALPATAPLQQLQHLSPSTLLLPHRLRARAGLALVTCRVVEPLGQPFILIPQQHQGLQHQEQDALAACPTVSLLVRCAATASPLLCAIVGCDASIVSDTAVAALSLDGQQLKAVQLNGEEWVARPFMGSVDAPADRVFSVPSEAVAADAGAVLLAQNRGNCRMRLVMVQLTAGSQQGQPGEGIGGLDGRLLHALELQEGECIREAAWQTGLLEHGADLSAAPASVLGLLTSQRVLLLAQDLTVLVAMPLASFRPHPHLLWLGPALVLATAGGQLSYIDVDARSGVPSLRPLCALDQGHVGTRVLAALPDRLVYAARAHASGAAQVLSRPLLPLEPLLLGSLALLPRLLQRASVVELEEGACASVASVVDAVVACYGPAWLVEQNSTPVYGAGEGPGPNAGSTGAVCVALARAGFVGVAARLAGIATKGALGALGSGVAGRSQEQGAYPGRPWVPAAVKAGLAAGPHGHHWMAALAEALADDPAAQEYALNPASHSTAALPTRHRRLSRALVALGEGARRSGQPEAALRLLDVAGEDEAVVSLLLLHLLGLGSSQDIAGLLHELFAVKADPHVLGLVEALWPEWRGSGTRGGSDEAAGIVGALVGGKLSGHAFPTAMQRRPALLPTLSVDRELPGWRRAEASPAAAAAAAASASAAAPSRDAPFAAPLAGVPATAPPRAARLRRLLLGRVEEWLGRSMPEELSDDEEGGPGEAGFGVAAAAGVGLTKGVAPAGDRDASSSSMATWVKGVGQGREDEDNVVLYYRFSEMIQQHPQQHQQGQQQFQGDVSPYGHVLEVQGAIGFEPSTAPIDPGDGGKVRPAMDAVWSDGACGLRILIPRGSALDVGPYHPVGPRARLTAEVWVHRPEDAATAATSPGYEVLLARRAVDDADEQSSVALWSLGVAADGALALWTGNEVPVNEDGTGTPHRTAAGMVPAGRWTHVAFTLEAKGKTLVEVALFVGGKPAVAAATPVQLRVPALAEARLRSTALEVGPNLVAGSRLTELRVWALLRHADDLYDNRESYLKLAEKRRRLAFKIKGGAAAGTTGTGGEEAPAASTAAGAPLLGQTLPAPTTGGIGMPPPPPPPPPAVARRRGLTPSPPGMQPAAAAAGAPPSLLAVPGQRWPLSVRRPSPTPSTEAAPEAASSSTLSSLTPALSVGWASEFGSWEGAPTSTDVAGAPPEALAAEAKLLVRPTDLGVDAAHVLRDPLGAPAFSPHGHFLCLREQSPATAHKSAIVVLALSGPGAPRRMRYPFQADSAILVEGEGEAAETSPLIACATAGGGAEGVGGMGALAVYDLAQRKGVARLPSSTQIVHWRWLAPRQLALVTARAVFAWSIAGGPSPPPAPSKRFERRDGARRVRGYHESGGWGLLLSGDDGEQGEAFVVAQLHNQHRGQLYLETGGGLLGAGIGQCDGARGRVSLVAVRRASGGGAVCLELYDTAAPPNPDAAAAPPSLLAALPKLAEVTLAAGRVEAPVWVLFPKPGTGKSTISVLFASEGLLASWRPVPDGGPGEEGATLQPLFPSSSSFRLGSVVVCDACLDAQGDLLVLQEGNLTVWRVALK
jgi:hypothetical protein